MKIKNKNFTTNEEIINFKIHGPITSKGKDFYELDPFPNYEINDNKGKILKIGDENIFLKSLKNFIGFNKSIIEFGAGTCQLSNYLAIGTNNVVYAFDSSFASLKIGKNFSKKGNIENITFVEGDIFDDIFHDDVFDFVICNGVLHHTKDPYGGFLNIIKSLKKEGYILVGLYNKIGRIRTTVRKYIYKLLGKRVITILDPVLRKTDKNSHNKTHNKIPKKNPSHACRVRVKSKQMDIIKTVAHSQCSLGVLNKTLAKAITPTIIKIPANVI